MDKLYIVIPAYNESENIEKVAREWHKIVKKVGPDSRLVIVDDGSKDNTYELLCDLQKELPQLEAKTKPNGGHGQTLIYAYRYALDCGADYIFQTDSDGQTEPREFGAFWKNRKKFDAIIGQRTKRQDGIGRVFVTKVLKLILFIMFGTVVPDANTPFRLLKRDTLEKGLECFPDDYNLPNVLMSVYFVKQKYKLAFVPITFRERQGGVNSINMKKISKIGVEAIRDFYSFRKYGKVKKHE